MSLILLAAVLATGCSKSGGSTPQVVAQWFLDALEAGNWSKAADLMAWEQIARSQNPDWDSFPASQRNLIIGRLKEQQRSELQSMASRVAGAQIGAAQIKDNTAILAVQSQAGAATLTLKKGKKGWEVLSLQ